LPDLFSAVADLFYPNRCLVCQKAGTWLHEECRASLIQIPPPLCEVCGKHLDSPLCQSSLCQLPNRALDKVRSAYLHTGKAREAVLKLKFKGVSSLANTLAKELVLTARQYGLDHAVGITAVPLHPQRLRERGYNQAGLLAKALSESLEIELWNKYLVRSRQTRTQIGLNRVEREENVRAAFEWRGQPLNGKIALVIDDVCTTGATLNECATALKAAGAGKVWALTLTRE
jgi:ComF family protein